MLSATLNSEPSATFGSAAFKYSATVGCAHSPFKTVSFGSLSFFRLVSSFGHFVLIRLQEITLDIKRPGVVIHNPFWSVDNC